MVKNKWPNNYRMFIHLRKPGYSSGYFGTSNHIETSSDNNMLQINIVFLRSCKHDDTLFPEFQLKSVKLYPKTKWIEVSL